MTGPGRDRDAVRVRREPPPFRRVEVARVHPVTPWLVRVTLTGPELAGFTVTEPAASVRLLIAPGAATLVVPRWNGNEFLLPDGTRPTIRTFTPRRVDPDALELDLEIVIHGTGPASEWGAGARPGAVAAVSGPGRGYAVDGNAVAFLLAGDETAVPAISQLLEVLPSPTPVHVVLEVAHNDARLALPHHPHAKVEWHDLPPGAAPGDALVDAVRAAPIDTRTQVWAAGEAAAVQRIRKYLFGERAFPRAQTTIRGYWKHGRAGGES